MEDQKLFRIGEVARMFRISAGTLRHYEQEGLLEPEYIDAKTGYRYYGVRQFEVLNTIRYLRVLDISLPEIADFLRDRDIQVIEATLEKQQQLIEQKMQELTRISKKLDHRLKQIKDAVHSDLEQIKRSVIPESRIVWMRDRLRPDSYLDLEYSIRRLEEGQKEGLVFLGKVGLGISKECLLQGRYDDYGLIFLQLDDEDFYEGKVEKFPEMSCVTIRFKGSHTEAGRYYRRLMEYIQSHNLQVDGFSREITLIDYGITSDTEKFVTEISIPVRKCRDGEEKYNDTGSDI